MFLNFFIKLTNALLLCERLDKLSTTIKVLIK